MFGKDYSLCSKINKKSQQFVLSTEHQDPNCKTATLLFSFASTKFFYISINDEKIENVILNAHRHKRE